MVIMNFILFPCRLFRHSRRLPRVFEHCEAELQNGTLLLSNDVQLGLLLELEFIELLFLRRNKNCTKSISKHVQIVGWYKSSLHVARLH